MSIEHSSYRGSVEKGSAADKAWRLMKEMVNMIPSLIGGILGFSHKKK